jgi:hypothetical protein
MKAIWHYDLNQNIGLVDKFVRFTLGGVLIGVTLLSTLTPVGWTVLLPLIAIPIFISAITGWDPIYALFQKLPVRRLSFFSKKPTV